MDAILPHKYDAPCKTCLKRTVGCHGKCKEYNEFRIKEAEYRRKYYQKENMSRTYKRGDGLWE